LVFSQLSQDKCTKCKEQELHELKNIKCIEFLEHKKLYELARSLMHEDSELAKISSDLNVVTCDA